jgi:TolB protein
MNTRRRDIRVVALRGTIAFFISCSWFGTIIRAAEPAASIESKYLTNVKQFTSGFVKAGEGYFSPDGKMAIYQAQPKDYPFYQIYQQSFGGGEPTRVSTGRGRTTCSYFSPDGKKIVFASSHLDPDLDMTEAAAIKQQEEDRRLNRRPRYQWDFDPHMDIFEADLDGKNLRRLTNERGYDAEGAYSRDGKLIAFCSDRDGDPDLYVMDVDGKNLRQLTNEPGYDGGPFISPDGKWVVYRTDRKEKDRLQIHVIGIDGKNDVALTDDKNYVHWAPYWHPSEPYLIWCGADHAVNGRPNYDLWLLKYKVEDGKFAADGEMTRVTENPAPDVLPVFSPDGKRLMWTSGRTEDRSSQLFVGEFKLPGK